MKKRNITLTLLLVMLLGTTNVLAKDKEVETIKAYKIEDIAKKVTDAPFLLLQDAIKKAQIEDLAIQSQSMNIKYAEYDRDDAEDKYYDAWDIPGGIPQSPEQFAVNYHVKISQVKYENDILPVLKDQVAIEISNLFDEILDKEEQLKLAKDALAIEEIKLQQEIRKEELGLASKNSILKEKADVKSKKQEINTLQVSIDSSYRKLNDKINGEEDSYTLIKPLEYEPLEMRGSIDWQIEFAINSDPNISLQEESALEQERLLLSRGSDGWAPTYSEYKKRELAYEQGLTRVRESKQMKKEQVKTIYDNIKALEEQRVQVELEIEEASRQREILKVQRELGFITKLQTEDINLAIKQLNYQLNNITRNHNKLKEYFEKPHLQSGQIQAQ